MKVKEPNYIELQDIAIDWYKFRYQICQYHDQVQNMTGTSMAAFKTWDCSLPEAGQTDGRNINIYSEFQNPFEDFLNCYDKMSRGYKKIPEMQYRFWTATLRKNFPYVIECLERIENQVGFHFGRIRSSVLGANTTIPLHTDLRLSVWHLPVVSNDQVIFQWDDEFFNMPKHDRLYVIPVTSAHSVQNLSGRRRLHLLISDINETDIDLETNRDKMMKSVGRAKEALLNLDSIEHMFNLKYYDSIRTKIKETEQQLCL